MFSTPVTAFYAALLAFLFIHLSVQVMIQRRKYDVALGDGDEKHLRQFVRAHSNFAEYVPFALLLMLISESNHVGSEWVHLCGVTLIFGRMLHAYGMHHHLTNCWQRVVGIVLTFLSMVIASVLNLMQFYF